MAERKRRQRPGPKPALRNPATRTVVLEAQAIKRAERCAAKQFGDVPLATALRRLIMIGLERMERTEP